MHWIDPSSLPLVRGSIVRFLINTHGELDGLVLGVASGDVVHVHFPPHMGRDVRSIFEIGDKVGVRGVRPRHAEVLAAVALEAKDGVEIIDHGPEHGAHAGKPDGHGHGKDQAKPNPRSKTETHEGGVRLALFAPKGELRGALLGDGMIVHVGKKEAEAFAGLLVPGRHLAARGRVLETADGSVLDANEIGPSSDALQPVEAAKPKKPKKPDKHGDDRHGDDRHADRKAASA